MRETDIRATSSPHILPKSRCAAAKQEGERSATMSGKGRKTASGPVAGAGTAALWPYKKEVCAVCADTHIVDMILDL